MSTRTFRLGAAACAAMRSDIGYLASARKTHLNQSSRRCLHANWSYLLNHVWLYKNGGRDNNSNRIGRGYVDGIYESDSPSYDLEIPSVLFLHDAHADHQMGLDLAKKLVEATSYDYNEEGEHIMVDVSRVQCLMVDIR